MQQYLKLFVLTAALAYASQSSAQSFSAPVSVSGTVHDESSARGIPDVDVRVFRGDSVIATATTDTVGRFVLPALSQGRYALNLRRIGYAPRKTAVEITSDTLPLDIAMPTFRQRARRTAVPAVGRAKADSAKAARSSKR